MTDAKDFKGLVVTKCCGWDSRAPKNFKLSHYPIFGTHDGENKKRRGDRINRISRMAPRPIHEFVKVILKIYFRKGGGALPGMEANRQVCPTFSEFF